MSDTAKIKEYIDAVSVWNAEIDNYETKIEECKQKRSGLVAELKKEAGQTFEYGGKWYMAKSREKSGIHFLVEMDKKPGSWSKKEIVA